MHTVWVRQAWAILENHKRSGKARLSGGQPSRALQAPFINASDNASTFLQDKKRKGVVYELLYSTLLLCQPRHQRQPAVLLRRRSPTCWRRADSNPPTSPLFPRLALCPPSSDALLLNPAVCAQCEDALDQVRVPPPKMKAASSSAWSSALAASRWTSSRCCKTARSPLICPPAGYGRLQSADPVTGYYREQERPGSPLRAWDTLFGCGELRFCVCPCPVSDLPLAPAAPCEDRLSGGAGPLL